MSSPLLATIDDAGHAVFNIWLQNGTLLASPPDLRRLCDQVPYLETGALPESRVMILTGGQHYLAVIGGGSQNATICPKLCEGFGLLPDFEQHGLSASGRAMQIEPTHHDCCVHGGAILDKSLSHRRAGR